MSNDFYTYKIKMARENRVVDLKTGNILEIAANAYNIDGPCHATYLDNDGYYESIEINEDNYIHYPYISDYMKSPENKAVFTIMFQEFERLRKNLRNV